MFCFNKLIPLFISIFFLFSPSIFAQNKKFRLHLFTEPAHLDPQLQQSASSNYLVQNLYRNFYKFDDQKGLVPDLGQSCQREKNQNLTCEIKKDLHWSDGTPLTTTHFLKAYLRLLDPNLKTSRADLLFKIKNAKDIYLGKKKPQELGVQILSPTKLRFELDELDPDFEYNLANVILAPWKDEKSFSGPYQFEQWDHGKKIILKSNPQYHLKTQRPDVEFYFISEDSVALQLYEKDQLDFLRRLPSSYIAKYKQSPDFNWLQVTRFDYFGFGPSLKEKSNLRKALSLSLNYIELQKIYTSEGGRPGCSGLPETWTNKKNLCHNYNLTEAKKILTEKPSTPLHLSFSQLGGEDHRRTAEWMQSQWKQNLDLNIQIRALENKLFIAELKNNPPDIFRKGLALERPTCLAALEIFSPENEENFIQLKAIEYQKIIKSLKLAKNESQKRIFCEKGIRYLLENSLIIPTGSIHFAILAKSEFKGWRLNQLNQLDLSELKRSQ